MSSKLFFLQTFGKIKPVEKIEAQYQSLLSAYEEFSKVEKSEELKELLVLESFVQSAEFKRKKAEIESIRFEGSKEQGQLKEFQKLDKSKSIRKYFEAAKSDSLKKFESLKGSKKLAEFAALKDFVKNGAYGKEKAALLQTAKGKDGKKISKSERRAQFEKSEAFAKFKQFSQLVSDSDIKFYFTYEKSSIYTNFLRVKDSSELKRHAELKKTVESDEFAARKKYLEDKNKWEKTEEFAKQKRYLELKKQPHIERYFKYKANNPFGFFNSWELVFEDKFQSPKIDESKWSVLGYWAKKLVGDNFSQPGDLQHFTAGANIQAGKNGLAILVKKEKTKGKIWNPAAGFSPADFNYTSGQLNSGDSFRITDGIVEAKIRFNPRRSVVSSFYLSGEKVSPQINILESGVKNRMGLLRSDNGKIHFEGESLNQLKVGKSYIFGLEKAGLKATLKINGVPVFELNSNEINQPMFLNFASIVVDEIPAGELPSAFEIEWVRCYRPK